MVHRYIIHHHIQRAITWYVYAHRGLLEIRACLQVVEIAKAGIELAEFPVAWHALTVRGVALPGVLPGDWYEAPDLAPGEYENLIVTSRRALALTVTPQVSRCRKRANFGCSRFGCSRCAPPPYTVLKSSTLCTVSKSVP